MNSVLPTSFSWGFNPNLEEAKDSNTQPLHEQQQQQILSIPKLNHNDLTSLPINMDYSRSSSSSSINKVKRRHQDEDEQEYSYSTSRRHSHTHSRKSIDKFRIAKKENMNKKTKTTQRISGQPLPTPRVIEVLDKKSLQALLNNLIQLHPEITGDVYKCSPKPTVNASIAILTEKVEAVLNNLPYKVDASSEYSYLRVKPYIDDFLNALSDYTLNFLAPVETTPANSLNFLDQATTLLHKLPTFSKSSNNYFKDLAYEQLGHTWVDSLREFMKSGNDSGIYILIKNNWETKLKLHNEESKGKLHSVWEFFKEEVNQVEELDSAKKFNFSISNYPLSDGVPNNLLDGFK